MLDLGKHAPNGRRIRHLGDATDAAETEPDQCFTLRMMAAYRAAGLFDFDDLVSVAHLAVAHFGVVLDEHRIHQMRLRTQCRSRGSVGLCLHLAALTAPRLQSRYFDITP